MDKEAEVVLGRAVGGERDVLASVSFEERLYVQAAKGYTTPDAKKLNYKLPG